MRLDSWLKLTDMDEGLFAELIGVSRESVRRYKVGERIPSREIMPKIYAATKRQVAANDFYNLD